jgi:N6-adenosine-specific RNA methylase IME4
MITTLPAGQYGVIYADAPWHFRARSPKGEGRSATQHYPCMSLDEICALPVQAIAAPNSVLFLWIIDPMRPAASSDSLVALSRTVRP